MGPSLMPACLRLVVADRSGALALGSPWHLARLGTWHVIVVTVLPWSLPACLVFSLCVLAARARRACPAVLVCRSAWRLGLARLGTWHALALGTWPSRPCARGVCLRVSSSRCVCSLRVLAVLVLLSVCVGRPGALALGSPWHLARLGTWHVIVATVRPWNLPARLVFSLCVLAAPARRACPAIRVYRSARRLGTWPALALGTPWHLARDRRDRALVESTCDVLRLVLANSDSDKPARQSCVASEDATARHAVLWESTTAATPLSHQPRSRCR